MSLQRSVDSVNSKMSNGLAFLATVGSTAPFVGLFGTVWGILNALVSDRRQRPGHPSTRWPVPSVRR